MNEPLKISKKMYHNTNKESGETLIQSDTKALKQEKIVLAFFERNLNTYYSPDQVWDQCFERNVPLTSIRRAITDLTKNDKLEKTALMIKGFYGKAVHTWIFKKHEGQTTLNL